MKPRFLMARAVLGLSLAGGCAEESGTGGRSVFFDVAVEAPAYMEASTTFVTDTGWEVQLDEAVIAIGPFYLWENPPVAARSAGGIGSSLFINEAHAHPGITHFDGGQLRGEFLQQTAFDLVGGHTLALGEARGIAGRVRSMTVVVDPPRAGMTELPDGAAAALRGYQAYVVGTAWRGDEEVAFEGGLELGLAEDDPLSAREVTGIPLDIELDDGHTLSVGIHPKAWFDAAQFETLLEDAEESADGRKWIGSDTQVGIAWRLGAQSRRAFYSRWRETH